MPQSNTISTIAVDGSTEGWLPNTRDIAQAAAVNTALYPQRIEGFMADTGPTSPSTRSSTYTTKEVVIASAKQRMASKLAAFDHQFNTTANNEHT